MHFDEDLKDYKQSQSAEVLMGNPLQLHPLKVYTEFVCDLEDTKKKEEARMGKFQKPLRRFEFLFFESIQELLSVKDEQNFHS